MIKAFLASAFQNVSFVLGALCGAAVTALVFLAYWFGLPLVNELPFIGRVPVIGTLTVGHAQVIRLEAAKAGAAECRAAFLKQVNAEREAAQAKADAADRALFEAAVKTINLQGELDRALQQEAADNDDKSKPGDPSCPAMSPRLRNAFNAAR